MLVDVRAYATRNQQDLRKCIAKHEEKFKEVRCPTEITITTCITGARWPMVSAYDTVERNSATKYRCGTKLMAARML